MRTCVFQSLIQSAVALGSPLVGCDETAPGIEKDPGFVKVSCGDPKGDVFRGLTLDPALDYLDLRSSAQPFEQSTTPSVIVCSQGVACGGAADQTICNAAFSKALNSKSFLLDQCVQVCTGYYMLATRGDEVLVLDTPESVKGVLGMIDTPPEAMLLVEMRGFNVPCRRGGAKPLSGGVEVQAFSLQGCDGLNRHLFDVRADGVVVEIDTVVEKKATPNCVVGRRPAGLTHEPSGPLEVTPLVSYLSDAARLEAASIYAFRQLTRELSTHRAPRRLIAAARRAVRDEVRHARVTAELARRFGAGTFQGPSVRNVGARDLETIATENATEGCCVRETFGAAVGAFQALRAQDPTWHAP